MYSIAFLFAIIIIVGVGSIYMFHARRQQRTRRLAAYAGRKGFQFVEGPDHGLKEHFPAFQLFQLGDHQYGRNIIKGKMNGDPVTLFDFICEFISGGDTTYRTISVVILRTGQDLRPLRNRTELRGFLPGARPFTVVLHAGDMLIHQERAWDEADFELALAHVRKLMRLLSESDWTGTQDP